MNRLLCTTCMALYSILLYYLKMWLSIQTFIVEWAELDTKEKSNLIGLYFLQINLFIFSDKILSTIQYLVLPIPKERVQSFFDRNCLFTFSINLNKRQFFLFFSKVYIICNCNTRKKVCGDLSAHKKRK